MRISSVPAHAADAPPMPPARPSAPVGGSRRVLLLVLDGLRPDSIDAATTPNLAALAARGVSYDRSRTGFPSETMVGAGELWAGAYPETSGITANWMPVPGGPRDGIELKSLDGIDRLAAAHGGRALGGTSLFEALAAAGRTGLVIGKEGPTELALRSGATWAVSTAGAWESATGRPVGAAGRTPIGDLVRRAAGAAPPPGAADDGARSDWFVRVAGALDAALAPDLLAVWLTDPDKTQHGHGLGSGSQAAALRQADAAVGALLADLARRGQLDSTDVVVTSDHGFSEHLPGRGPELAEALDTAGLSTSSVVASGNAHMVTFAEPPTATTFARLRDVVAASPFAADVMTIVDNPRGGVAGDGRRDGRLTGHDLRHGSERAPDAWVVYRREEDAHVPAKPGTTVAGHGSLGWSDLNNVLLLAGPGIEQARAGTAPLRTDAPAGIVDVAPTILNLLGAHAPATMHGRVLREALAPGGTRDGAVDDVARSRTSATADTRIGDRVVRTTLQTDHVDGTDYFAGLVTQG